MQTTCAPRVIVGVDGSLPSLAALRYAVAEARRRGASLHAVRVAPAFSLSPAISMETAFARALGGTPADVEVFTEEMTGAIADALTRRAHRSGDVVVVGTRGRGRWHAFWYGSTSRAVLRAAHCPVVVVPAAHTRVRSGVLRGWLDARDPWRAFDRETRHDGAARH